MKVSELQVLIWLAGKKEPQEASKIEKQFPNKPVKAMLRSLYEISYGGLPILDSVAGVHLDPPSYFVTPMGKAVVEIAKLGMRLERNKA